MYKIVSLSFLIVSIFVFSIISHSLVDIRELDKTVSFKNFYKLISINDNLKVFAQNNSKKSPYENKSNNENISVKSSILLNNITNIQVPKNAASSTNNDTDITKNNISNKNQSENHTPSSLPTSKTVIIVKGAALLRDQAFSPNPIKIHTKDSINWINKDDVVHTVTSGASFSSPDRGQEFDSGMLGSSYTHKFMKPGEYNYFCQIHPTMVGKIIVEE
jgi:plastocyanin